MKMRKYIMLHLHPWLATNPETLWFLCLKGSPVSQGEYAISSLTVSTLEPVLLTVDLYLGLSLGDKDDTLFFKKLD